jgi:hypothetical protein
MRGEGGGGMVNEASASILERTLRCGGGGGGGDNADGNTSGSLTEAAKELRGDHSGGNVSGGKAAFAWVGLGSGRRCAPSAEAVCRQV